MTIELTRKPASATNDGELDSSITQTIPGTKVFSGSIATGTLRAKDTGGITIQNSALTTVGSVSNAGAWSFPISAAHIFGNVGVANAGANGAGTASVGINADASNSSTGGGVATLKVISNTTANNSAVLDVNAGNASYTGTVFKLISNNTTGTAFNLISGGRGEYGVSALATFQVRGDGNVTNSNNSYGAISDASLKENIADATPKLADLMSVQVRSYNLKTDSIENKQIGVIAQELEEIFPGMVDVGLDGLKSVKYSVFVPMLIKAIQEQQQIIESLKARIEVLEA
jgi:hypothetical protein